MHPVAPSARAFRRLLCTVLAFITAVTPSAAILAQTNAAQQAIRQRVSGLEQPEQPEAPPALPVAPTTAGMDTSFIAPGAAAVIVIRPAQIMTSPITEMLPREVATAAALKYLGIDPVDVDELVAFGDLSNPGMPGYGLVIKFNKPFRAASIPVEARAHAQLAELNGKKYLRSQHPLWPSFYGSNTKTLVLAPDATLQQLVAAQRESANGPILDRIRQAPAGSDLFVAIDVAALRPLAGMYSGVAAAQVPADVQPFFDLPNLISAIELTLNLTGPGPTSLVAHANDEAAADQVLSLINDANQKRQETLKAQVADQAASEDPVQRAFAQYAERVSTNWMTPFMPTRDGTRLTLFHSEGLDDSQKKMLVAGLGIAAATILPAATAAREAAGSPPSSEQPETDPASPVEQ